MKRFDIRIRELHRLAAGRRADVFAWQGDTVVKLFQRRFPGEEIEREAEICRRVHAAGLPAPKIHDLIAVRRRVGIVMARIDGPTMIEAALSQPLAVNALAQKFADLHADIFTHAMAELPRQSDRLAAQVRAANCFAGPERRRFIRQAKSIGATRAICHGDFHPDNVIMTETGPMIVDWGCVALGDPAVDVAQSRLLMDFAALGRRRRSKAIESTAIAIGRKQFTRSYMSRICDRMAIAQGEIEKWMPLAAAVRLAQGSAAERDALLALTAQGAPADP